MCGACASPPVDRVNASHICNNAPDSSCTAIARKGFQRTLCPEELARDVEGFAAHNDDLLAVQQLLRDRAGETAKQMALAVYDNNRFEGRHGARLGGLVCCCVSRWAWRDEVEILKTECRCAVLALISNKRDRKRFSLSRRGFYPNHSTVEFQRHRPAAITLWPISPLAAVSKSSPFFT